MQKSGKWIVLFIFFINFVRINLTITFQSFFMRKTLLKASILALTFALSGISAWAAKYVIYPVPHSLTMNSGSLTLTDKVNVVCESTIDRTTQERLVSVLATHGIEAVFDGTDESRTTFRLGTVGSGEEVEAYAVDSLKLGISKIMVSKTFDRHAIKVSRHGVTILGEHTNAVFYALASLEQMLEQKEENTLPFTTIYDRSDQQNRGLVEGYYGYPYSVEVKKDLMRYMMRFKMNTYMFGAKSDPYHSQMWKDAYPTKISAEQEKNGWLTQDMLRDLAKVSGETKVNFIWAIHPGNEFLGSNTVIDDIMSKFEKMYSLGIRHFGVFVDDVGIPSSDADMKKNADRLTALQKRIEEKWNTEGSAPEDTVRPLHFVPQIYCNSFASSADQRKRFMAALSKVPSYITVYSTGQGVWSVPNNDHTITVMQEFGRAMGWWWNYPCNDNADGQIYPMDMYSNFVDMPAVGNGERLPSKLNNCQGIVANPMQQGQVAKTSLFSIADYAWNNAGFKNEASWEASFKTIISDEQVRQAYHDITYYLRWNEPESMQTLINNYKNTLAANSPNSANLKATIQKIKGDCEKVITLKDSETQSDRLLYADIAPWVHTLHTYSIVIGKMLDILDNPINGHKENWPKVKEVCDSLDALENSTLYTAYALEGMGNGISVSQRQAQLSRRYLYPFIAYLKEKAIDTYFQNTDAITEPSIITNSPLLNASLQTTGNRIGLSLQASNLDINKYVGVALPEPSLIEKVIIQDDILPYARFSTDGKEWKKLDAADDAVQQYAGYFIFLNEGAQGIKDFEIKAESFSIYLAKQAKATSITIPDGNIYEGHTADKMVDGNYDTYTCLNRNQQTGDLYTLDLGTETILHDVRLCMGIVNGDYPHSGRIQYSADGKKWANLKVKGNDTYNWSIDLGQNVKYNDEMVYCDFDGAGVSARYVRLRLISANTSKWMRLYEIEVNRQYAENGTLAACTEGNGTVVRQLTDHKAQTGLPASASSPLTYSINRHYDIKGITFYSLPTSVQPTISVTTDGTQWESVGSLTEACQTVDLQSHPKARAVRLEWESSDAPAIYEITPEYDPNTSSLPQGDSELAQAFALLKAKALNALDSCGQGDKLITQNSQFSSPYTEPSEGSLNNLLDGDQSTYWHSAWSGGAVADGVHYLEIALPEKNIGKVIMHMGRRSNTDGHHLIEAQIIGVTSGSGTSAETELVANVTFPYSNQRETVKTSFTLQKPYPAIRLMEQRTTGNTSGVSAGFFHIGELQLYSTTEYYKLKNAQAEADALFDATEPLPSEATEEDLKALQEAYDAFMYKVFGVIPSDIEDTIGQESNNSKKVLYNLKGQRVKHPKHNGIYIMNGKKIIAP